MSLPASCKIRCNAYRFALKLMIALIAIISQLAAANSLPNRCSRDPNLNEFTILSYHEISNRNETLDLSYTVTPLDFKQQVDWLINQGYHFISMDDIINHRENGAALPMKSVLLTFDDGYQSFYTNAFPIIKKYKIPAVLALVGSWLDAKDQVDYDGKIIPRDKFLTQKEIKEIIDSGLIEIANHSYSLHKGISGNPQGDMEPAATTIR